MTASAATALRSPRKLTGLKRSAARRWPATLFPLLLANGCASAGSAATPRKATNPSTMPAPIEVQAPIVQAAWPGETIQMVKGSAVKLDAFEGLLVLAGVDTLDQLPPRERPLDREGARRLLTLLMEKPLPLRAFPQRTGACFLLREVLESGAVSRAELNHRVDRFRQVAVLRPDGYLAWVLSGRTQQRAGPGQLEFKDGVFKADRFVLGQFYSGRRGAYRPVDAQMQPLWDSNILGEVYDDSDLFGRAMDGAEESFFALAMAVGKFLSRPLDGLAALRNLPAGVAALIASSPEYLERFKLMTAGEQIQAVSRLTTTLLTMFAGSGAVTAGVTRGLGGLEATGITLSAQGTVALGRVVVPVGEGAMVLAAGAGVPIILQAAAAAPVQGPGAAAGGVQPVRVTGPAQQWWPRISAVAPDWATKGAHIHIDGIELAVRPSQGGGIVFTSVFSGQRAQAVDAAIGIATRALGDIGFRQRLFNACSRALQIVDGGKGAELRFLMRALEKMGL